MTDGLPDPLNETAKPPRRWITQALIVGGLISIGIIFGAKIWQPVRKVEQNVTAPIRAAVRRDAGLGDLPDLIDASCPAIAGLHLNGAPAAVAQAILLTQDGFAATTFAVPDGAAAAVWLEDGRHLPVSVSGRDDLAGVTLLKIDAKDLPTITLGDMDLPRLGSWGFTLASPIGRGCAVEAGLVASDFATEGSASEYYLRVHAGTAAPLPGTPFLTGDGRVAGLAFGAPASALAAPLRRGGPHPAPTVPAPSDHYLPIDLLTRAVSILMRAPGNDSYAFGLIVEDLSPALADRLGADRGRGAVIVRIGAGGVAAKAGLQVGDVILSAGQSPVSSSSEFERLPYPGRAIDLTVSRGSDQTTRTITLTPPAAPAT